MPSLLQDSIPLRLRPRARLVCRFPTAIVISATLPLALVCMDKGTTTIALCCDNYNDNNNNISSSSRRSSRSSGVAQSRRRSSVFLPLQSSSVIRRWSLLNNHTQSCWKTLCYWKTTCCRRFVVSSSTRPLTSSSFVLRPSSLRFVDTNNFVGRHSAVRSALAVRPLSQKAKKRKVATDNEHSACLHTMCRLYF